MSSFLKDRVNGTIKHVTGLAFLCPPRSECWRKAGGGATKKGIPIQLHNVVAQNGLSLNKLLASNQPNFYLISTGINLGMQLRWEYDNKHEGSNHRFPEKINSNAKNNF